jgi:hypothetical protein
MKKTAKSSTPVRRKKTGTQKEHAALFESICGIAEQLQALNQQAVIAYAPLAETIIRSGDRDIRHIERTLDGLLDFCAHDPALQLYRRLCRHYYDIDPAATVSYVEAYREMWDSEMETAPTRARSQRTRPSANP